MRLLFTVILLCVTVSPAVAEKMAFDINLSGTSNLGNTLTLFGTLLVDPALPIDNSNIGPYSLFVQRNAETSVRPLSFFSFAVPNETLGTVQMAWSLSGNDLYVSRTSALDSSVVYAYLGFNVPPPQPTASFNLGSGALAHSITYGDTSGFETAVLKGASAADGPNGFLVGRAVVPVPAPSSLLLGLTGAWLVGGFARCRRRVAPGA